MIGTRVVELPASVRSRLTDVLGPVGTIRPLGATTWMVMTGARPVVAKCGPGCPDEAAGLRQLRAVTGGPQVPEVLHVEDDLLVVTHITQGARTPVHEEALGQALAGLHRFSWPTWGGGSSWIGNCPVEPSPKPDGVAFYGARLGELAARCGLDKPVGRVVGKLGELLPPGGPVLLHGDLWWGNVLFGADGRAWLVDPSVHGGHPEEDLGMLALFGPVPDRLLRAYAEVRPLSTGWEERVELFQLYPLLVHTVLFGGIYRARAETVARRFA